MDPEVKTAIFAELDHSVIDSNVKNGVKHKKKWN